MKYIVIPAGNIALGAIFGAVFARRGWDTQGAMIACLCILAVYTAIVHWVAYEIEYRKANKF